MRRWSRTWTLLRIPDIYQKNTIGDIVKEIVRGMIIVNNSLDLNKKTFEDTVQEMVEDMVVSDVTRHVQTMLEDMAEDMVEDMNSLTC